MAIALAKDIKSRAQV